MAAAGDSVARQLVEVYRLRRLGVLSDPEAASLGRLVVHTAQPAAGGAAAPAAPAPMRAPPPASAPAFRMPTGRVTGEALVAALEGLWQHRQAGRINSATYDKAKGILIGKPQPAPAPAPAPAPTRAAAPAGPAPGGPSAAAAVQGLYAQLKQGQITSEQFTARKRALLGATGPPPGVPPLGQSQALGSPESHGSPMPGVRHMMSVTAQVAPQPASPLPSPQYPRTPPQSPAQSFALGAADMPTHRLQGTELVEALDRLHQRRQSGDISLQQFEQGKAVLLGRSPEMAPAAPPTAEPAAGHRPAVGERVKATLPPSAGKKAAYWGHVSAVSPAGLTVDFPAPAGQQTYSWPEWAAARQK